MALLEMEGVDSYYDKSHVLFDVSLSVEDEQIVALVGRNGAGKTTTLKSIMGMVDTRSGTTHFDGEDITNQEPYVIAKKGIAYIPEGRRIFPELTVEENLRMGHLGHGVDDPEAALDRNVYSYFPRLEERREQKAGSLSGGEQQMLTIGRALISDPDFLLVDEPTEGLMPELVDTLEDVLRRISQDGKTILLVEQNVDIALSLSDHVYIIDEGQIQVDGKSEELLRDDDIKEQYLAV